jgi:hypothetical protein
MDPLPVLNTLPLSHNMVVMVRRTLWVARDRVRDKTVDLSATDLSEETSLIAEERSSSETISPDATSLNVGPSVVANE